MSYPRESVQFCDQVVNVGINDWAAGPNPGPIMVVSTETTPGSGAFDDPHYAEVGSESIALAGLPPVSGTTGTWVYIVGRWPIKKTKKVIAGSWSTIAILQQENVGTYERHRVYVLNMGKVVRVRIWLQGTTTFRDINFTTTGPDQFVETLQGPPETLSPVQNVPANPAAAAFVQAVKTYAQSKNLFGPGANVE